MTEVGTAVSLLALYLLCAAGAAGIAVFLRRRIPPLTLAVFVALPLLLEAPIFFAGKTPIPADHAYFTVPTAAARPVNLWADDVARQFAPWAREVRAAWKDGILPHRNRWNGCGMVLDANGSSAAYSPFTLAAFLVPLPAAFGLWASIRILLCLAGAWLWLTELSVSPRAAVLGAASFSLSLSMTAWLSFPQTAVLSLWPWVLFAIERVRARDVRRRATVVVGALFALWPLSGHIETVASASAFTALWILSRRVLGDRGALSETAIPLLTAAAFALGATAFATIPQALAIAASNRLALVTHPFWQPILSLRPHGPAWPDGLLVALFPRLFGDRVAATTIPGGAGGFPEMALGYFGIVPAALALSIFRPGSRRSASERALVVPLVVGLGAAVGAWPFAELTALLPALSRMLPLRYLTWLALAGAAVAAFELDRLFRDLSTRRSAALVAAGSPVALLLLGFVTYRRFAPAYAAAGSLTAEKHAFLLPAAALALALAAIALAFLAPARIGPVLAPLLAAIAAAELLRQGSRLATRDDPAQLYPVTPLVRYLQAQRGPFRIVGEGAALFPNVSVFAKLEEVRTHDPVERRDYVEFLDATCGYEPSAYFKQIQNFNAPALDFLNVRYFVAGRGRASPGAKWRFVYSGEDGTVFENSSVLPRVVCPTSVRAVRRSGPPRLEGTQRAYGAASRELFARIRWADEAVLLQEPDAAAPPPSPPHVAVSDYAEDADRAAFRVRSDPTGPPGLVVASLVQDGGWSARDETGRPLATALANGPFLAIAVPPGDHRIRLDYATPGFRLGAVVSALALAAAAALALAGRSRRRSSRDGRSRA